jgi:hypothetical protein
MDKLIVALLILLLIICMGGLCGCASSEGMRPHYTWNDPRVPYLPRIYAMEREIVAPWNIGKR